MLEDPTVQAKLADTKAANEVKALNQFFQVLHQEPDRALYGPKHVEKAADAQAIDTLLISDKLFRFVNYHLVFALIHSYISSNVALSVQNASYFSFSLLHSQQRYRHYYIIYSRCLDFA